MLPSLLTGCALHNNFRSLGSTARTSLRARRRFNFAVSLPNERPTIGPSPVLLSCNKLGYITSQSGFEFLFEVSAFSAACVFLVVSLALLNAVVSLSKLEPAEAVVSGTEPV